MAVTSGYFDSYNHDRLYSAEDVGSLLDGIITDGILNTYGGHFAVTATGGLNIRVSSGRGWFKQTWIKNDGNITLTAEPNASDTDRTDTVVIDINKNDNVRANTIKIVKGGVLVNASGHWQYPLYNIIVGAQSSTIKSVIDRRNETYAHSAFNREYWPVGAIYLDVSGIEDPAVLFGGIWKRIAGRFLIGAGHDDYLNWDSGLTMGSTNPATGTPSWEYTINVNNLPTHNHYFGGVTTTNVTEIGLKRVVDQDTPSTVMGWANNILSENTEASNYLPASWNFRCSYNGVPSPDLAPSVANSIYQTNAVSLYDHGHFHSFTGYTGDSGGGSAMEIRPPYLVVNMWARIG